MDLSQIPLFRALSQKLGFLEDRQRVLAQNIANVDTPNYQPRDLKAPDFGKLAAGEFGKLQPVATDPQHFAHGAAAPGEFRSEADKSAYESTISGNSVSLEQELIKVSQTTLDHQTMVDLYRKQIGLLKTALDRGGS